MNEQNKKMIEWLNAELSKRGHENIRWGKPEDIAWHFQRVRNAAVHSGAADTPLPLRAAAAEKVVTIQPAVERDEAMPIRPIKGSLATTEESDTLRASNTVTFDAEPSDSSPVYVYSSHPEDDHSEKFGGSGSLPPPRRIALPPGYVMERVTRCLFFFARTTPREFEEIVADYQYDMIKAEAKGATAGALWRLRAKYWGAYAYTVAVRLPAGIIAQIVGEIIKKLRGG